MNNLELVGEERIYREIACAEAECDNSGSAASIKRELPLATSCWSRPETVFRFDAAEFYLEATRENADYLHKNFSSDLIEVIRIGLGGYTEPDLRVRFSIRPKQHWPWRLVLVAGPVKVEIFGPGILLGQLVRKSYHKIPIEFQDRLFPSSDQIFTCGYRRNFLGMIRITNPQKLFYSIHQECLQEIVDGIESRVSLRPKKLEVCLDTLDPETGTIAMRSVLPSYFNSNMLYHFDESGNKVLGPSPNGEHEYVGYRPKGFWDTRPNSERPRGGRRVCHPHIHHIEFPEYGVRVQVFRCEFQLFTTYLTELMKQHGINSVGELMVGFPTFLRKLFRFRTLNLDKLYREHPDTRSLGLESLSIRGQYYALLQNFFEPGEINRFLVKIFPSEVVVYDYRLMVLDLEDGDAEWDNCFYDRIFYSLDMRDEVCIPRPEDCHLHRALWFELDEKTRLN